MFVIYLKQTSVRAVTGVKKIKRKKINLFKIVRIMCITAVLVMAMVFALRSSASGLTADSYKEIVVCPGDTLWGIAKEYRPGEHTQKVIYEIMNYNNMEMTDIFPGQKLKIPLKN